MQTHSAIYTESLEQSSESARAALGLMSEHRIPPTPRNFIIWYSYFAGTYHELNRAVDILLTNHQKISSKINDELYEQFFDSDEQKHVVESTGVKIQEALGQIMTILAEAGEGSSHYGEVLRSYADQLAADGNESEVTDIVANLLSHTRQMESQSRSLEDQLRTSSEEVDQLKQDLERVRQEATIDALTRIANRKHFDERLREIATEATENGEVMSLLMIDIDHFKKFNDNFGHQIGDQVLRLVAKTLHEGVKGQDLPARYGGEEFAIVLPRTRLKNAVTVAENIRSTVGRQKIVKKKTGERLDRVTLSIGAAQYTFGEPLGQLITRADKALYLAKENGRNRVESEVALLSGKHPRSAPAGSEAVLQT